MKLKSLITAALLLCFNFTSRGRAEEPVEPVSAVGPLLRILQSGNLPEDRLGFVFNIFAERGNAYDLGVLYDNATKADGYRGKSREAALETLARAARQRNVRPQGDLPKLLTLMDEATRKAEPKTYERAVDLAGLWQLKSAAPALTKIATAKQTDMKLRRLALDALVRMGGDEARQAIGALTANDQSPALQYLGVAALTKIDLNEAVEAAIATLAESSPKDDPSTMMDALLEQQKGAERFAAALSETSTKIAPDVAKRALRHVFAVGRSDELLVNALCKAAGISTEVKLPSPDEMQQLIADVQSDGDPQRGESIFRRADLNCMKCHALNGAGGQVGPDLVDLGGSQPIDYLIESVLLPEKAVKEEYQLAQVTDYLAGKRYQGIVQEETEQRIVLKGAQGEEIVVAIEDPEEIEIRKGGSLMPQGLVRFLTRDEVVDLVSFLGVLGKPDTSYAKNTDPVMRRWRVLKELPEEVTAEAADGSAIDDETFLDHLFATDETAWNAFYSRVDGTLPIAEIAEFNAPVFLRGQVEATTTGKLGLELTGCDDATAWINERRISLGGQTIVDVDPGISTLIIQINPKNLDAAGLQLRLFRPQESPADVTATSGA